MSEPIGREHEDPSSDKPTLLLPDWALQMTREFNYRLALLNIAGTARKWAVSFGGNTPLAIVANMAREALGLTAEQVDAEIDTINAARGRNSDESK